MADHKNQHYVPRCHLRPFSLNGEGRAINLILFDGEHAIKNAPVKSQCARSYFYDEGGDFERSLGDLEGTYASIVRKIEADGATSNADREFLRDFSYFQYMRTETAARKLRFMHSGMADLVFEGREEHRPKMDLSDRAVIRDALGLFFETQSKIGDLTATLIYNTSNEPFITSDDPASLLNRFHNIRLRKQSFGVASSGLIITMPLHPRWAIFSYDSDVYRVDGAAGVVETADSHDARAFNRFLMIKQSNALFFQSWAERVDLAQQLSACAPLRKPPVVFQLFVRDGVDELGERYRGLKEGERVADFRENVILTTHLHPAPASWPSFLKYRAKITAFSDGSSIGHVRRSEWLEHKGGLRARRKRNWRQR